MPFFHQGTQHGCIPLANCAQKPRFSWCSGNCLVILQAGLGQICAMTCNVILHSHISQKVPLRLEMPGLNLVRLWMKKYEVVPGSSHCWDATIHTSNIFKVFLLCSGRRSSNKIMSWTQHILGHPWASSGLVASLFLKCLSTGGEGWKRHSGLYWPGLRTLFGAYLFPKKLPLLQLLLLL